MDLQTEEVEMMEEIRAYYRDQRGLQKAMGLPFQTRSKRLIRQMERKGLVKPVTVTMCGFPPCVVCGWELA